MPIRITNTQFFTGFIFILIGTVLLLRNLDLMPSLIPGYLFTWPIILIVIGLFNLIGKNDKTSGFILISIGLFFILPSALGVPSHEIFKFWPVLLIIAGASIFLKQSHHGKYHRLQSDSSRSFSDDGLIEASSFLGGTKRIIDPIEFKGGNISAFFGGNEIDFSQCTLAEGKNYIHLSILCGGTVLIVPSDWNVQMEVTAMLGGFADERTQHAIKNNDRILVIKGAVMLGGGELKSR
ncbi:MAG: cell wall-active antibiotics response protein [Bacteroidota bacterium]|nr:cell wall-active antibiotics response protein [Bacteroidota bacterium]